VALSARAPFDVELRRAADHYFAEHAVADRDRPAVYGKAIAMLVWLFGSYAWLVFATPGPIGATLLAVSCGLAHAGVGMGLTHDANHGALSRRRWINRGGAAVLDLLGCSSWVWRTKHNVVHHSYANVAGLDDDLDVGPFGRLSIHHRRRPAHRIQHLYLWPLYGGLHLKWVWFDDFQALATGKVARQPLPRPRRRDLAWLIAGKVIYLGWSLVLPLMLHPIGPVLVLYLLASAVAGVTVAVVFQLAHCVDAAEFPATADGSFAAHQLATTVDFAPRNWMVTWYVGGLNYQIEHHLFPRVSHVHYPALARIVADVAARHGIRYRVKSSLRAALAGHYRHLRALAR
jgi:linoleoyl-CoA desaturase